MDKSLGELLDELEAYGIKSDNSAEEYSSKYLNLEREAAELICLLIKLKRPKKILEIGTSNGYSTIWFASVLQEGGKIITVERSKKKLQEASANFAKANLHEKIEIVEAEANEFFQSNRTKYDIIFLDANRKEYMNYVERMEASIQNDGLIICDNALSHKDELSDFHQHFIDSKHFDIITISVGKGVMVITPS